MSNPPSDYGTLSMKEKRIEFLASWPVTSSSRILPTQTIYQKKNRTTTNVWSAQLWYTKTKEKIVTGLAAKEKEKRGMVSS